MQFESMTSLDLRDYFDKRMMEHTQLANELREIQTSGRGVETIEERCKEKLNIMLQLLLEDNIILTRMKLNIQNYPGSVNVVDAMSRFIDSQRFITKVMYDVYAKPYM